MREILFRGKRTDNGEWVEGYYLHVSEGEGTYEVEQHFIKTENNGRFGLCYEVIPETVGQYTNVTTNDKKIFDGDILKVKVGVYFNYDTQEYESEGVYVTKVECKEGVYIVDVIDQDFDCTALAWLWDCYADDCEVDIIGNIHDNPELLKEGAE